jgi:hypothetical protein
VEPFVEWSKRRHAMRAGLGNAQSRVRIARTEALRWRAFCSMLWRNALWAGLMAYRLRLERLERSVRRDNKDRVVEEGLDARRQRTKLLAESSENNLRIMLAVQLSVGALRTLVDLRRTAEFESPTISAAVRRAVTALDSNLDQALTFAQEWSN